MESDDQYLSLGFQTKKSTFFSVERDSNENQPFIKNMIFSFMFSMNMDAITHNRSIYTLWDVFGDVGGLFDGLIGIGHVLIFIYTWTTNHALEFALVRLIFDKARD